MDELEQDAQKLDQEEKAATDTAEQQETQEQEVKTFTQDEVNKIVQARIDRERKKLSSLFDGDDLTSREREIESKALRLDIRAKLMDEGLPRELEDLLDYTDQETCDKSLESAIKVIQAVCTRMVDQRLRGGTPPKRALSSDGTEDEQLRDAFKL